MNEPQIAPDLYEADFSEWALEQARLLREGQLGDLDIPNLIEEIEGLSRSQRNALASRLGVVVLHLLKERYQPEKRSRSWLGTILEQQRRLEILLDASPSLRRQVMGFVQREYPKVRKIAAVETGLPTASFPAECPFTLDEILGSEP